MSSRRKFNRKSKYTLSQKIISAVTAAGFIMQPVVGFAQAISKADGQFANTIIDKGNGVTDIWADKVVGNAAVNVFDKFQLEAGKIANMYFSTITDKNTIKDNLVNFVNDRIDINGTVNAVKGNEIGGNLFFLSKDGMAVGKSGVINTGSLYVMTPANDKLRDVAIAADDGTEDNLLEAVTNITTDAKAWQEIPVNASGTITVLGQVNATNEVQMRAAKIGVGKNVDDKVVDKVEAGAIVEDSKAHIKTGVTDFSDIVNINYKDEDGNDVNVNAGITDLEATVEKDSGDIILSAYVDNESTPNAVADTPVVGDVLDGLVNWGQETFTVQNFDASVDVYGTVDAAGKADISATAVNSNVDVVDDNYKDNNNENVAQLANVNAEVNIGNVGKVTAKNDVTVKAEAINRYIDDTGFIENGPKIVLGSTTPLTGDVAYSVLDTDANVNIENGATVTSTGGDVNINAKAETLAASAASTLGLKFKTLGGYTGANVPAVAVVYTEAHNDAKVTVNGNVTAAENVNIDAVADLRVEAENKMTVTGENANQFVVGVTIANAENKADVIIGVEENKDTSGNVTTATAGNSVTANTGNLTVNAKADSDFTSKTSISAGESSAVGVAVNVTEFDSGANVKVNTKLEAGNDLTVNAADTVAADNVMAESKVGSGKYMSSAMQVMGQNGTINSIKGFASNLAEKMLLPKLGEDLKTNLSMGDVIKAGATITYSGQSHTSNVTIGNDASLNAGGKLDIDAQTLIEDAHFTATGATNSYNDATSAPVTLNAAVLVTNMNNSSSVVVKDTVTDEDGTEHKAKLKGTGGVDINASTRFEYNRVQKMKDAVTDAAAQIENAFKHMDEAFEKEFAGDIPEWFKNLETKYKSAYEAFNGKMKDVDANGQQLASGDGNFIDAIVAGYQVLTALDELNAMLDQNKGNAVVQRFGEAFKGASDLFSGALAFVDPNSYGTFAAASTSKGSSGDVGGSAPGGGSVTGAVGGSVASAVNGAGAVMVNTVNSVSKVEIGSDAEITSKRKVNIGAENYMKDVSLGGLNLGLFNNAGGGTSASIGATVNYAEFDTDTIVAVNDGASITGGYINVNANNEIDHVSVAASAGKGPSAQTESDGVVINGMLSFVNGSSDILTVVDDGASLTANKNGYKETVKDEETGEEKEVTGNISINGHNNTNITNVAAGASWGKGSAAVGVGLAYTDFEVKNITGVANVADQINGLYTYKERSTDDDGEEVVEYVVDENKVKEFTEKLTNDYKEGTGEGRISAYGFSVDAATDGSIQSVSAAGSLSNDDASGQIGFFDKINSGLNSLDQKLVGQGGLVDKASSSFLDSGTNGEKMNGFFTMGQKTHGADNANKGGINIVNTTTGAGGKQVNTFMPSFSLAGSGSVSINMLDNATEAIVDNAKITMQKTGETKGDINVTARDTLYAGAYSGAAAVQWNAGGDKSDKSVSVSGAAGVNDIANAVKATIKNSTIEDAGELNTMALSGGEQLALGLGMAVVKADGTTGYSGNAAVSVNLIDHDVEALLENNTVTDTDDVNVTAYARDIENAGGGGLTLGQQKVGVGATVGVAMLHNNISAGIKGGRYEDVGNVDVEALNALQNITVGIAAGVTAPSGNGGSANVQGAGVYNEVHNTTNAFITGTKNGNDVDNIVISTVNGGSVNVTAQDVAVVKTYEDILTEGLADGKQEIAKRMGKDFDITGKTELAGVEMDDAETELNKNKQETETKESVKLDKNTGSSIITVAGSIAGSTGKAAVGGAAAITDIENNYTANIDYAEITTENLTADAGSDSNIVTVAGGVAAANKGSGVGSVSWNDVDNTAKVDIKNSVVKAQNTAATAKNTAQIVSVGGQVSASGKAGVGATLSYIGLDNSTEANITNTTFNKRADEETDGITVKADAQNTSDSYNVGFGVAAGGTAGVSGTVVVTQTKGTAGAVMDYVTINNAKTVTVNALDATDILSVIGNATASGKAAVGAGVAYTEIGGISADKEKAEQHVTAEINNSTINTIDTKENEEKAAVNVTAKDTARVINVAVGIGGATNAAVQGASATTLINKTTGAEMNNTSVYGPETGSNANVNVDAQNDSEITSSADVAAAAVSGAGVGAGIAVNRIIQQTNAAVNGGTMNVNNLDVNANAAPQITNIGVGIGVAGSGAGVTGSVAVNMIENDVTAHIGSGANIAANNYVGVVATSDEQIANYAGNATVSGSGAAVGLSVSYNELTGNTTATIDGDTTSVSASGNDDDDALTVKDTVEDGKILDNFVDESTFDSQNTLGDVRVKSEYKGVAVSASSTHAIKSFIINGGVAGTGAAVNGTVNVNQIGGSTKAAITGADINTASDVNVIAHDYTNSAGMVGTASIAGTGAGVGLGSDTNTVSREVTAEVSGKAGGNKNTINAAGFNVEADAKQGISSLTVSLAAAGVGGGVSNATSVALLEGVTTAKVNNANITANSVNVAANHTGKLSTMGTVLGAAGLGAGVGVGVSVLNEDSETTAELTNSNIKINNDEENAANDIKVNAANTTNVNYQLYSVGIGLAGVAGAIGVSNVNSKVNTNVDNVAMDSSAKADNIDIGAENSINFINKSGSGAGGAVGVGVGVAVNTIDSQVSTNVNNAQLFATNDINVTAKETRKVEQMAVNAGAGAVAGGANVMITNVGSAVADSYGSGLQTDDNGKVEDGSGINTNTIFDEANEAVAGNKLKDSYTYGVKVNDVPEVTAEKGADDASVVEVNIINSSVLEADNKVTAEAVADTNVTMDAVQASGAALVSATGTVGILDVNRNSVVNISGTKITAKDLAVRTTQKGTSSLDIYQGNVGGSASIGAAYGSASSTGVNNISVSGSELNIGSNVDINANDESKTAVNAFGVTLSPYGGAASVIVAQGSNDSSTEINVNNTDIKAGKDINIHAERQAKDENGNKVDSLSVKATAASGGLLFAGAGIGATADERGTVGINVTNSSNFTADNVINVTALNAPSVRAEAGAVSGSMLASGAITVAEANIGTHIESEDKENENKEDNGHLKTFVNISDGNSFTAESLTAEAKADAVQNVTMDGISISASLPIFPGGAVQANTGGAEAYSDVTVTVGNNVFKGNGTGENAQGIDLNIKGINNVTQTANAKGISVSTFIASGTNIAETKSVLDTDVTVGGAATSSSNADENSNVNNVDISAESTATVTNNARGDGGAIADISPYAAMTDNDIDSTTDVTVGGNWNIAGDMYVNALHTNNVTLKTDAVKAAIVGGSGVHSDNEITNNTNVTFDNAIVTTGGSQYISAHNDITYNADIQGSGYGVVQGAAVTAQDDITSNTGVTLENDSALDAKGSVNISAVTGDAVYNDIGKPAAAINKNVTIKSAGVVAGTYAESTDNIKFANNINVGADSSIKTTGTNTANADINLTAADRTNFTDIATADTQGGVVGASWTEMNYDIDRTNNIIVGGTVDSNYDANFDAGDTSKMNLTLRSNAYNKTAAPLVTNPSLNGSMEQTSAINFAAGSSVKSLRNINAAAGAGDTTIAKESKTWRWVDGGETGTGSIASTSDGTLSGDDAKITTTVTVDGSLEAGKNHQLDITINYADGGKENMENAFDLYDNENLKLSDLGQKLEDAQDAYNKDENVGKLKDAVEKLNKYKEQQENNEIIKDMLQGQINDLEVDKTAAVNTQSEAQTDLNNYVADSLDKYNSYLETVGKDTISDTDFVKLLEAGETKYAADYETKNEAITAASNAVEEIQKQIDDKVIERDGYKDYTKQIQALEKTISDLKDQTADLEAALKAAQENYDKALESGITEKVVNNAIFNGHIGDEKDTYVNVNASDWYEAQYGSAAEQIGMIDYAASLLGRMDELIKMSQQYTGTDVGDAYTAELARIQSDLQALGLLTFDSNGIGIAEGASSVPTIELKDLLVSGGNVNISADTLTGAETGSIIAHGDPSVTITNNTDFFLRVNDVTVESDGGKVSHNDVSINPIGENYRYNGIGITAVQGDSANSNNAQITIQNTKQSVANEKNKYDGTLYTPDIGIYGEIYNPFGNINIENKYHNIYVSGEYTEDGVQKSGNITGRTINLTAGGSVTQGYSDEIYNAAGAPEAALSADYITAIQNALIEALGERKDEQGKYYAAFDSKDDLKLFLQTLKNKDGTQLIADEALDEVAAKLTGKVDNSNPGIAAGGAIYINAASINVNGTIQSGFEDYKLAIKADKEINDQTLQELINSYNKDASVVETNYDKYMNDTYLVTDGKSGAVYENGKFVYNIKAWYNPETNEIFTEDIEQAGGGRIYLTGAIANTNASGGKLVVLDGGSKYEIDGSVATEKKYTFKLGSINADTVAGLIKITDTSDPENVRVTEYTKDSMFIVDEDGNRIAEYQPTKGLYYNWSNGTSNRVTTSYKHVSDSSWWGLKNERWEDVVGQIDEKTKEDMQVGLPLDETGMPLKDGNVISDGTINAPTDDDKYIQFGYDKLGANGTNATSQIAGSSEKTDNSNIYQILFERSGKPKQGKNDKNELLYLDANGELTTVAEGNTPYYLKDENGNYIYETVISDKVTTTKKKGLLGLWGKTVTTEWKETSGMITAYNFGLKADNSIGIEFVGQAEGSTGTIKSNSDILLGGDIHMGTVNITSGGSINHVDTATVISDDATFKAETGIDVIQKNVDKNLHLDATTTSGNINIQAIASNANNDVYIDNVSTGKGNVNAETNNVSITAEGDLLNGTRQEGQVAVVSGDSINLQSYGGSIGTETDRLLIDGDVSYTDGDTSHGAINAKAAGSVYLTEVNGNMYLGEIVAEDGNVVLEVTGDGAGFVDAIVNNSNDNKDDSRIEEWTKLGLLGADTVEKTQNNKANQLTNLENAAKNGSMFMDEEGTVSFEQAQKQGTKLVETGKEFVKQMKGANATVQKARDELNTAQGKLNEAIADLNNKDEGSEAVYKNALEAYNNAYDAYEKANADYEQQKADFIANSGFAGNTKAEDWLTNYEAIGNAAEDNYGWKQQQLMYAVQDTVINPNAGSVSDVKTANVTGNNITFISDTGNLGVVDTMPTTIGTDELTAMFTKDSALTVDEQAKLDKLSSARAGDVVWGADDVVIRRTTPVSIKLNKNSDGETTGTVTVQSKDGVTTDHIYLLAKDSVLNANEFAANDLRLSGQKGLNVNEVIGNSIYLEGGSGDIGALDKTLQAVQVTLKDITDTTGKVINGFVSANAAGNVALQQVGDGNFTLGSVAGTNINITANGDIVSKANDISYINASDTITLTSGGGIGTATDGLRIKNSGAVVNTNVQSAINIEAKQDGTLILGIMDQKNGGVNVDSEGSIYIGRENDPETAEDENEYGYIDAKDDVNLHAAEDIIISGMLHVNKDNGNLNLQADNGDITQTTIEAIENIAVDNLNVAAIGGDVKLDNPYNVIEKVDVQAVGGSLGLTVSNAEGFNVEMGGFINKLGGDVTLTNSGGSVKITTQDITDPTKQDEANINGSLTVTADRGDKATEADINNEGILNATDTIKFTAVSGVIDSNTVNGRDVIMQSIKQELENIIAKDSVTLKGDEIYGENITQNKDAAGDLIINTGSNGGNGPIESLVIDKVDANDKSVFTDLWAVNADITTADDKMDFNKILIEEMAWLENTGTLATVYGNIPVKDENANVHIYQAYPYMYFNFVSADTVETDGRLLSLDNYWYVYDQRFTAEDHMRWQHGRYLDEDWKQAYGYGLSLHDRYGLIDYQHFTEENAGEDEIAVEA